MKVFFDTNVLIDVLAKREPFYTDSASLWTLAERRAIEGLVSAISFTNIYYIVRRLSQLKQARRALVLLRDTFTPVACDADIIRRAIDAPFKDFEDAVQHMSAVQAGAACLVSRNPDHFSSAEEVPVLTPSEFLAAYEFE